MESKPAYSGADVQIIINFNFQVMSLVDKVIKNTFYYFISQGNKRPS
jgi:hypothetical protein